MTDKIVVIGAGQAGLQAVVSLRGEGYDGALALVGDEPFPPYQRPPLSKAYLLGKMARERLFLKPDAFYAETCELILGVRAAAIDRAAKTVRLEDGRVLGYDKLLIATGTRARTLPCPGAGLPDVHSLRGIADVDALKPMLVEGRRAVIVGAGYIGLEVAAVAATHGLQVTVVEALDRVLARSVSNEMSDFFAAEHRKAGVALRFGAKVAGFEGTERLEAVRVGGETIDADFALVGIGALPNVEIARAAGLACDNGITVDEYCATSDPDIFAAGDCTWHPGRDGGRLRLESVQNAIDQAKCAAHDMLGTPTPYREVPWFWSDQYDLKLQIAGLTRDGDTAVRRGDPMQRKFAVFYVREGCLAAAETVNMPGEHLIARKLIAAGTRVSAEALADPAVALKTLL